jgi:hypothetical protein
MAGDKLTRIPFNVLWENYPDDDPCVNKDGKPPPGWDNQCAVRVSTALTKSGASLASFKGGRCPTGGPNDMIGSAQQLAKWLADRKRFENQSITVKLPPKQFENAVAGRPGIIFFSNYWRRRGEHHGPGTGDHIDLWNGSRLTARFTSFLRFTLGINRVPHLFEDGNWYSDLHQSSEVRFWHVL